MYYSLFFTPEQVQLERWINRTLNKTEPTAKEKIRHVGKNTSYSYETIAGPLWVLPSRVQGGSSLCPDVPGSGSKTTGEGMAVLPHTWPIPDRQAIPESGVKCFHSFLPYSSASTSGASIFVPWLALVWGDEARDSSVVLLNTPSSSLVTVNSPWYYERIFTKKVFNWMTSPFRVLYGISLDSSYSSPCHPSTSKVIRGSSLWGQRCGSCPGPIL